MTHASYAVRPHVAGKRFTVRFFSSLRERLGDSVAAIAVGSSFAAPESFGAVAATLRAACLFTRERRIVRRIR